MCRACAARWGRDSASTSVAPLKSGDEDEVQQCGGRRRSSAGPRRPRSGADVQPSRLRQVRPILPCRVWSAAVRPCAAPLFAPATRAGAHRWRGRRTPPTPRAPCPPWRCSAAPTTAARRYRARMASCALKPPVALARCDRDPRKSCAHWDELRKLRTRRLTTRRSKHSKRLADKQGPLEYRMLSERFVQQASQRGDQRSFAGARRYKCVVTKANGKRGVAVRAERSASILE